MKSLLDNVKLIQNEAFNDISLASNNHDLEMVKSSYLGKGGKLTAILKQLKDLSEIERPKVGQVVNLIKDSIFAAILERDNKLQQAKIEASLNQEKIDITLPPRQQSMGALHPITKVRKILEDFFIRMGFAIVEGPEIETEFYNFTALNIPPHHPAKTNHDTFYFADGKMLRSQTSPVQIRVMESISAPLRIICPGRVFRRDNDATHSPMFHQLEMLMVDEGLTFSNLKWLVIEFIKYFFGKNIEYRFRPSYFPFTEPSAEIDVKWNTASGGRWLELGGCGVVHPNVLQSAKVDCRRFRGLAFGFGIERLAMIYYGIDDIRRLFENDLQFLEQFIGV